MTGGRGDGRHPERRAARGVPGPIGMADIDMAETGLREPHAAAREAAPGVLIDLRNIRLRLGGEEIYDDISFSVAQGELLCILGPSGCGKSTLLRLIGDLIKPASGEITIAGRAPALAWHKLAYVFQSPRLVPWRTALGNVTLAVELRFGGKVDAARRDQARNLLRMVGLEKDEHKFPLMLSGGERQRVAIARALAVEPEIILMDEPLAALDINTRRHLRREILKIWQITGKTVIFVTHDIDDALTLADRVLVLSRKPSRILQTIRIDEPRPRGIEAAASLQNIRARLEREFTEVEAV
jgi:NitT/TauT family transport system ATP-binding protein